MSGDAVDGRQVAEPDEVDQGSALLTSKLRRPPTRRMWVDRPALVDRLPAPDPPPILSVHTPAGYAKSTLLSQWAERSAMRVAWVSLDERDNDPRLMLTYLARALDAVQPLGELVFRALASPTSSVPGSVLPRLGNAFLSMSVPVLL